MRDVRWDDMTTKWDEKRTGEGKERNWKKRNTTGELNIVFAAVKSREKTEKTKSIM